MHSIINQGVQNNQQTNALNTDTFTTIIESSSEFHQLSWIIVKDFTKRYAKPGNVLNITNPRIISLVVDKSIAKIVSIPNLCRQQLMPKLY